MMATRAELPRAPPPRAETVRESIREALREGALTQRELSVRVGLPERAITEHLEHVARSARGHGESFRMEPARCLRCGFSFPGRSRFTRPSRCPSCSSEHLAPPRFHLVAD